MGDTSTTEQSAPVTRMEILDALEGAFRNPPTTREQLIEWARDNGARDELVLVLGRLQDRRLSTVRDLWDDLRDVPVE